MSKGKSNRGTPKRRKRVQRKPRISYEERAKALSRLGFSSYDQYLSSDLWGAIRSRVLARDWHECRLCGATATHVHHCRYSYETMSGADLSPLAALCPGCHRDVEFLPCGKRRSPSQAGARYAQRRRLRKWQVHVAEADGRKLNEQFAAIFRE